MRAVNRLSPLGRVNDVIVEADKILTLAKMYMERNIGCPGTITWESALKMAVDYYLSTPKDHPHAG